jgi:hypothetical protein
MPIHENDTDSVVFLYSLEDSFFYAHVDSHVKPKKYPTNLEPHSFFYSTCSSLHYTASFFFSLTNKIIQVVLASLPIQLYYIPTKNYVSLHFWRHYLTTSTYTSFRYGHIYHFCDFLFHSFFVNNNFKKFILAPKGVYLKG